MLLVRHGQASFGADDHDVLRRQQDTALLALPDAPLAVDRRWDEYDHPGLLRRYPSAEPSDGSSRSVQVLLDAALRSWVDDLSGGWDDFAGGVAAALQELVGGLGSGRDAVVSTSGGVVTAVCARLLGVRADGVVALHRVTVDGGITKLGVGRGGVSLLACNDHAHVDGPARELLTYR